MDLSEFEKDKTIDPSQLDVECVRQADIFYKWAERAVTARSDVDRLKLVLDVVEARLQADVRRHPKKYGVTDDRVTETGVKAAVLRHRKYVQAHDNYLDAREAASLLDAARQAMEMKKRALEMLVTLHGQEYFAGPGTPRNLTAAWEKHQEATGQSVVARQRKKLRKLPQDGD